jgi:hypothetical protein
VEVARSGGAVYVRDTENLDGAVLPLSGDSWRFFIAGVKQGDFDDV